MTVIGVISAKIDGWDTAPNTQYHIQTDEGPERYFRYQTISGQYRKEKRLQDGTVVGSYGWVDADGYLRLNDYIADNEGYRILRSKRLYVGTQTPIDGAISAAKYVPPQSGTEVNSPTYKSGVPGIPAAQSVSGPSYKNAISGIPPSVQPVAGIPASDSGSSYKSGISGFGQTVAIIPSSTVSPYYSDNSRPLLFPSSTQTSIPVSQYFRRKQPTPPPGYYPTSTQGPIALYRENEVAITPRYNVPSSSPSSLYTYAKATSSQNYKSPLYTSVVRSHPNYYSNERKSNYYTNEKKSTYNPNEINFNYNANGINSNYNANEINSNYNANEITSNYKPNEINSNYIPNEIKSNYNPTDIKSNYNSNEIRSSYNPSETNFGGKIYSNRRSYSPQNSNSREPTYDGVSVTRNGFKYYLPRHYHEEESLPNDTKAGSYGYIDPFGIRRVVYYNASPSTGFVHKKNNRYVGFDATPYDPRP